MIDGVGKSGTGRIDLVAPGEGRRRQSAQRATVARAPAGAVKSAVLDLVSGGAPVDSAKVEAVRAAIHERPLSDRRRPHRRSACSTLDLPRRG